MLHYCTILYILLRIIFVRILILSLTETNLMVYFEVQHKTLKLCIVFKLYYYVD